MNGWRFNQILKCKTISKSIRNLISPRSQTMLCVIYFYKVLFCLSCIFFFFFFLVPNNLETLFTMKSNLSKKIDNKQHSNDEHPAESGKEIQNFQMKREKNVNVACADASQSEVRLHYIIVFFSFFFSLSSVSTLFVLLEIFLPSCPFLIKYFLAANVNTFL